MCSVHSTSFGSFSSAVILVMDFGQNFQHCTGFVCLFAFILVGVELHMCICVYSWHSILECYNLFSGVKLSIRLFCFLIGFIFSCSICASEMMEQSRKV